MTTLVFKDFEAYEAWTEQFEECSEYEQIPTAIWDGWKMAADMFTECKSFKTALKRFEKAFGNVNGEVKAWVEGMRESCENKYFHEKEMSFPQGGTYSWGVEEVDEGRWYIFLNISGIYAEVERKAV